MEVFLGAHPEATVKALFNLWTRYSFKNDALKGVWVGAGFNHTGKKAQRTNNPKPTYRPRRCGTRRWAMIGSGRNAR